MRKGRDDGVPWRTWPTRAKFLQRTSFPANDILRTCAPDARGLVEHLVAFSCKRHGFCPSRGAQRMAESAALPVDEVFPAEAVSQWALSAPCALRFMLANDPAIMSAVLGIVHHRLAAHLIGKADLSREHAQTGAVTLIQR